MTTPEQLIDDAIKVAMGNIFERELTSQEYLYLLSRYPYLEVCNPKYPYLDRTKLPEVIVCPNGWRIFDYGNAMFASGSELASLVYRKQHAKDFPEEGDETGGNGTIVQQFTDVAFELVKMAKLKGWSGIEILNGYYPMQRMAWIAAELLGYDYRGFEPTLEDQVVYSWVKRLKSGQFYPANPKIDFSKLTQS